MKIGDRVKRQDTHTGKWGDSVEVNTYEKLEYHKAIQASGVAYVVVSGEQEED